MCETRRRGEGYCGRLLCKLIGHAVKKLLICGHLAAEKQAEKDMGIKDGNTGEGCREGQTHLTFR